jgi:hypothetical protein
LNAIVKQAWITSQQTEDRRGKIQALSLAKECYGMKLDLLTNATEVDDATRFVTANTNNKKPEQEQLVVLTQRQTNRMTHPFNLMNNGLQEQQRPADNDVSTCMH